MALRKEEILVGTKEEIVEYFNSRPKFGLIPKVGEIEFRSSISLEEQIEKTLETRNLKGFCLGLIFFVECISITENKNGSEFPEVNMEFKFKYVRILDDEIKS